MHLVGNGNRIADAVHDLRRQFKAEVHAFGSDVEQDVARGGDGVAAAGANLLKGMKLGGARRAKELVPGVRAESNDAGKTRLNVAELNGADQTGEVRAEGAHSA